MRTEHKAILIATAAFIVGLAIGALWQYAASRGPVRELGATQQQLALVRLEATLGAATIEAQRGSFEVARQLASTFFSGLQQEAGRAEPDQQSAFTGILQQRDAVITALSRSDPQAGPVLADLFTRLRVAMGEPVGQPAASSPPIAPADSPGGT
jgi:hypothetical protein